MPTLPLALTRSTSLFAVYKATALTAGALKPLPTLLTQTLLANTFEALAVPRTVKAAPPPTGIVPTPTLP